MTEHDIRTNQTHHNTMANPNIHMCTFDNCGKIFQKASRLVSHCRSHTGEKPYICSYDSCEKAFKRSDHLRRHNLACHWSEVQHDANTPPPVFSCHEEGCTAKFRLAQNLKKHIRRSHEVDSFKCHICGKVFKKHHQLTTHRVEHSQETKKVCSVEGCGKSFTFPNKLRQHMKTHEGYVCKEADCSERFDKWTLLVKHNKLKHGTVHRCSICEKVFSQKQWLKQHLLVHQDKRPVYPCTYENCSREYLDLRNLTAHISSYHNGQRLSCSQQGCGQTFSSKQKLLHHLRLHDPTRPLPPKKKPKKKLIAEKLTGQSATNDLCEATDIVLNSPDMEGRNTSNLSHLNIPISCDVNFNIHESEQTDKNVDVHDTNIDDCNIVVLKGEECCNVEGNIGDVPCKTVLFKGEESSNTCIERNICDMPCKTLILKGEKCCNIEGYIGDVPCKTEMFKIEKCCIVEGNTGDVPKDCSKDTSSCSETLSCMQTVFDISAADLSKP